MAASTLILWDIDGTLVRGGSVASSAFAAAVERVVGRAAADHGVSMGGKTDPQIAHEILVTLGLSADEAHTHVADVVRHLENELAAAEAQLRAGGRVLPGVVDVLRTLHGDPSVLQSVLTGNTAANAALKLAAFGLSAWLDVDIGAYGSDDADRRVLVPVALERARLLRGFAGGPGDVVVVGDTVRDYECALAGGARCVLVATGRVPIADLRAGAPGAEVVLEHLSDVDAVVARLRS